MWWNLTMVVCGCGGVQCSQSTVPHTVHHRQRLDGVRTLTQRAADLTLQWEAMQQGAQADREAHADCLSDLWAVTADAVRLQVAEEPTLERLRAVVTGTAARLRAATAAVQAAQHAPWGNPPSAAALEQAAAEVASLALGLQHVDALRGRLSAADDWAVRAAAASNTSFVVSAGQLEVCVGAGLDCCCHHNT